MVNGRQVGLYRPVKPFKRHADARPKATQPRAGLENTTSFDMVGEEVRLGLSYLLKFDEKF